MVLVSSVPVAAYRTVYLVFAVTCASPFGSFGFGCLRCCSVVFPPASVFCTVVTCQFRCKLPSAATPGAFVKYVSTVVLFSPAAFSVSRPTVRETSESPPFESGREICSSLVRFLLPSLIVLSFTSATCQLPLESGCSNVFFASTLWSAVRFCNSCVCKDGGKSPLPLGREVVVLVSCTSGLVLLGSATSRCTT